MIKGTYYPLHPYNIQDHQSPIKYQEIQIIQEKGKSNDNTQKQDNSIIQRYILQSFNLHYYRLKQHNIHHRNYNVHTLHPQSSIITRKKKPT